MPLNIPKVTPSLPQSQSPVLNFQDRLNTFEKSLQFAERSRGEKNWAVRISEKLFGNKKNGREELEGAKFLLGKARSYFQQGNFPRASYWYTKAQHLLMRSYGFQAAHLLQSIDRGQKAARFGKEAGDMLFKVGVVGAVGAWAGPAVSPLLQNAQFLGALKAWGLVSLGGAGAFGLASVSKRFVEGNTVGVKGLNRYALNPKKMNRDLIEGAFLSSLQMGLPLAGALGIASARGTVGLSFLFHQLKYVSLYQATHGAAEAGALGRDLRQVVLSGVLGAAIPFGLRGLEATFGYPGKIYARMRAGKSLGPWRRAEFSEDFTGKVREAQEKFHLSQEELANFKLLKDRYRKWLLKNHPDLHPGRSDVKFKQDGPLWKWLLKASQFNSSSLARAANPFVKETVSVQSPTRIRSMLKIGWEGKKNPSPIEVVDQTGELAHSIQGRQDSAPPSAWKISPKVTSENLLSALSILSNTRTAPLGNPSPLEAILGAPLLDRDFYTQYKNQNTAPGTILAISRGMPHWVDDIVAVYSNCVEKIIGMGLISFAKTVLPHLDEKAKLDSVLRVVNWFFSEFPYEFNQTAEFLDIAIPRLSQESLKVLARRLGEMLGQFCFINIDATFKGKSFFDPLNRIFVFLERDCKPIFAFEVLETVFDNLFAEAGMPAFCLFLIKNALFWIPQSDYYTGIQAETVKELENALVEFENLPSKVKYLDKFKPEERLATTVKMGVALNHPISFIRNFNQHFFKKAILSLEKEESAEIFQRIIDYWREVGVNLESLDESFLEMAHTLGLIYDPKNGTVTFRRD